jgi:DNA-binding CsgD family transcriptional regulator/tetratricopeptide (TPR) repeat protein
VDKSLLLQEDTAGAEPRFRMLETVREFALEQQAAYGEAEATRQAHAAYFLRLAEEAEPKLSSPEAAAWLERLEADHDNLRAALRWTLDRGDDGTPARDNQQPACGGVALRLAGALWRFWNIRGYLGEGRRWIEAALVRAPDAPAQVRAAALAGAGTLACYQGDYGRAAALCGQSLALCRQLQDKRGTIAALHGLAVVARIGGDLATAQTMHEEEVTLCRDLGEPRGIAHALNYLGTALWAQMDARASLVLQEALSISHGAGDVWGMATARQLLGYVAHDQGDQAAARDLCGAALHLYVESGYRRGIPRALVGLGNAALAEGKFDVAQTHFRDALALFREMGDPNFIAWGLERMAGVMTGLGRPARAAQILGAVRRLRESSGSSQIPALRADYARDLRATQAALDPPAFAAAWALGRTLSLDEALTLASETSDASNATDVCATPVRPPSATGNGPLEAASSAAIAAPSPLTAREREVAALIARGLTNKQIAAELIIAEGTANRHVANILGKLGFTSRARIAAWAVDNAC